MGSIEKIIVLTGAGVSTASGLPDFRSPGSGLYDTLDDDEISDPMDIFDISFFDLNPHPFYRVAKHLHASNYKPNYCHYFLKLLLEKNLLLRIYTQNIDGLERKAGIPEEKLIEAHGSFANATCRICKKRYTSSDIEGAILQQQVPRCKDDRCQGVIKPDVVFFGENLPYRFFTEQATDFKLCDLLIVMGTSLQVYPFASLANQVSSSVPRILINNEIVGTFGMYNKDVMEVGDIIKGLKKLTQSLSWETHMECLLKKRYNLDS
ncbi:uncharacterized protein TRIADDRAFT_19190 [Trichoplax adhaerens]|uniref:NAD-dependent protein deacetylase n=1 Tax=Trichoplax adhaerens TaxID=10228 RepID=B3RLQ6_TRIAD|nr:hypothetical protein TRIADDRAFT_19190 [Trichoplax adhaerens]EDV29570.1 hypothetical protein TRIADDRAFT_19190 [Trichoplax adhaerens]|eukprot:XP_002108772.1 hypothetical protein TRIADDRAFT_19190 [Trichoplax adhaerens]